MDRTAQIRQYQRLTLASWLLLASGLLLGQLVATHFNFGLLLIQLLPLLIALPFLIQGRTRAYLWLACILLLYAAKFISDLYVTQGSWLSLLLSFAAIALFACCVKFLHLIGKQRKAQVRK